MPRFDTPEPISVTLDLVVGEARVITGDRADTVVEVHPTDPALDADVRVAEQTRVEYASGRLLIKSPKQRGLGLFGRPGSVDVTIELPAGSHLRCDAAVAAFRCEGRLGDCRVKTSTGDVQLDGADTIDVHTGAGAVLVEYVTGNAEVSTGTGRVRVREVGGAAVIKNSNGDSWVGEAGGDLRMSNANGGITVDNANAGITAKTANGDIRVGGVTRGSTSLDTGYGAIEIGIRAGTAARIDAYTSFGRVRNQMDSTEGPGTSDETADVRARTHYGDIVILRRDEK